MTGQNAHDGQPTVSREVLEDRLAGLLTRRRYPGAASRLADRLDAIVDELVTGIARIDIANPPHDVPASAAIEAIHEDLRASVLRHVLEAGIARPS